MSGRVTGGTPARYASLPNDRRRTGLIEAQFVIPSRKLAEVFTTITSFERSVRDFIGGALQERLGKKWWEDGVSDKVRARGEAREAGESKFRWRSARGPDPMELTDMGDLGNIIVQNWDLFEPCFHSQTWAKNVFDVVEKSRNGILPSGELEDPDIAGLGVFIRDWARQVGRGTTLLVSPRRLRNSRPAGSVRMHGLAAPGSHGDTLLLGAEEEMEWVWGMGRAPTERVQNYDG